MKKCSYLSHEHPIRLAHRGSRLLWPENTLTAFQGAADHNCIYIETDLHVTKDNIIVTFHDDRLDRLTNGSGPINDWLWKDLKQLDAAHNFKPNDGFPMRNKNIGIPTLEEAMKTFPNLMFNLDLKQPGIEEIVANFIKTNNYEDRILIASSVDSRTKKCRNLLNNTIATSTGTLETTLFLLTSRLKQAPNSKANALQVPLNLKGIQVVDKKFIDTAHKIGLQVHVWTINDESTMKKLLNLGVDGIVTDRIDLLNKVIAELKA